MDLFISVSRFFFDFILFDMQPKKGKVKILMYSQYFVDLMRRQEELRRLEELRNQELQKRKQIQLR
jgi:hypothetical protein